MWLLRGAWARRQLGRPLLLDPAEPPDGQCGEPCGDEQGDDAGERRQANRAVGVSAFGLTVTGLVELGIAVLTGSVGLLGDALHNLSDVSTSLLVFLGFRVSRRTPSERYPYGLERAEDLAGLGVALVVWASAIFAGWKACTSCSSDREPAT